MEGKIISGLIILIAYGALVSWAQIEKSGKMRLQVQFDEYKLSAANELAAQVAQNTKNREAAEMNNEGVINDLNSQVQTARSLNSNLAQRLHDYQVRASSATLPKAGNNPGATDPAGTSSDRRLNEALSRAFTECALNSANYTALIREISPQL